MVPALFEQHAQFPCGRADFGSLPGSLEQFHGFLELIHGLLPAALRLRHVRQRHQAPRLLDQVAVLFGQRQSCLGLALRLREFPHADQHPGEFVQRRGFAADIPDAILDLERALQHFVRISELARLVQ